jgi:nudix-type nucleoside diphosphatase (YffH/AdpP family)
MTRRVQIIAQNEVFKKGIFRIDEAKLRYERYNGQMSDEITRLNLKRGDSVAAVVHDPDADTVVLTEQFRYPTYEKSGGWLLELPAGVVNADEEKDPQKTIQRELLEEIGYQVEKIERISTFYVSPGGSDERIHLYYAAVNPTSQTGKGGGLAEEGEDIKVVVLKVNAALSMMDDGQLQDAKTIIGLQWLQLHRSV